MGLIVKLPKMASWQKDVYTYWEQHPKGKWIVTLSPRQVGKSTLMAILLIAASMKEPDSFSISVSPIFKQSAKLYNDICKIAEPLIKKTNGGSMEITFINGSTILFASAQQKENLRGFTIKKSGILAVDEAAYINEDFFYSVCTPMTNRYNSDILIFSTPKWKNGFFYNLYNQGGLPTAEERGNVKTFNWTNYDLSEYLPETILNLYRKQLPKLAFLSEYLGEFISGDGTVFSDFRKCIGDFQLNKENELLLTIDWGCGNGGNSDSTVITIGQLCDDKIGIKKQIAFNDKKPVDCCNYILDIIKSYINEGYKNITVIQEKNSIGNVYYSMLVNMIDSYETTYNDSADWRDEIEINIHTFLTTNDSKKRIIERLEMLFEYNKIILPNDEHLINELSMFEAKVNSNGTVIYGIQSESHDDRVLSLCFLTDRLFNELNI